jgi:uncharacterized protein YjbJ (UPF0337 family)
MNRDQVRGATKRMLGKMQEGFGKLTGSKELQAKGLARQIAGKIQKNVGDAKQDAREILKTSRH